jgi:hypothetical protein
MPTTANGTRISSIFTLSMCVFRVGIHPFSFDTMETVERNRLQDLGAPNNNHQPGKGGRGQASVSGFYAACIDTVFLDFIMDRSPADTQHLGGLFLNPTGLFQGPEDGILFTFLQGKTAFVGN